MIQGVISIEIIYLWDTESGGSGGGEGQPDPDPEPDKEEEKCGHEICRGCNKPIRSNTRATLNCSHTEDEYCKSSGPVCDCGERHCDDNEIPKCSTIEKKVICKNEQEAYPVMWNFTKESNKEIAAALLSDRRVLIEYNTTNTYYKCVLTTTCSSSGKKYIKYEDGGKLEKLSYIGHLHTHTILEKDSIINNSIKAKHLVSEEDEGITQIFNECYIIFDGLVFKYKSGDLLKNNLCPIFAHF